MQESEFFIKIISYLLGIVISIIGSSIWIVVYVWRRHVQDNDREHKENREAHIRIHARIDEVKNKRK